MNNDNKLPAHVKVVEVGPRDGLQNETALIAPDVKIEFINRLSDCGLTHIEAGSFVSSKAVPQMVDTAHVLNSITRNAAVRYAALTPNVKGFEAALTCGVDEVAVFTGASEDFTQKNIHCSIRESLQRFEPILVMAQQYNVPVRAYVSTVIACPYVGTIAPAQVRSVVKALLDMGCYEVSLGDTIGVGTPKQVNYLLDELLKIANIEQLAGHFHDTYGQAIANIYACLQYGMHVFDASVAGLGGCPYAAGATGNVATEDVVYLLNGLDIKTNIDLQKLILAGDYICEKIGRKNTSKVSQAMRQHGLGGV